MGRSSNATISKFNRIRIAPSRAQWPPGVKAYSFVVAARVAEPERLGVVSAAPVDSPADDRRARELCTAAGIAPEDLAGRGVERVNVLAGGRGGARVHHAVGAGDERVIEVLALRVGDLPLDLAGRRVEGREQPASGGRLRPVIGSDRVLLVVAVCFLDEDLLTVGGGAPLDAAVRPLQLIYPGQRPGLRPSSSAATELGNPLLDGPALVRESPLQRAICANPSAS